MSFCNDILDLICVIMHYIIEYEIMTVHVTVYGC